MRSLLRSLKWKIEDNLVSSRLMLTESDIAYFAKRHEKRGESELVGVYAGIQNKYIFILAFFAWLLRGPVASGAVAGGFLYRWGMFFANEKRLFIAKSDILATAVIEEVIEIDRKEVKKISVRRWPLGVIIRIKLKDGRKFKIRASRNTVLGHKHHKERLTTLLGYLGK